MNSTIKTSAIAIAIGSFISGAFAAGTASDTAANYVGTWGTSAANLGSGFGAWSFTLNNASSPPYVGTYLDQTSYGNPDGVLSSGYAWGTYANGSPGNGSIDIARPFTAGPSGSTSLYNQTFSVGIGSGNFGSAGAVGLSIGSAFNLSYAGGGVDNFFLSVDGASAVPVPVNFANLQGGLLIALSVNGPLNSAAEAYTLTFSPFVGATPYYAVSGTFDSSAYNTSSFTVADANTLSDAFFNNPNITPETAVPEPTSLVAYGLGGLVSLLMIRRRK